MTKRINLDKYDTLTSLTKRLNKKFGKKKSGEPFTTGDIENYIRRGNLPGYLGGNRIKLINNDLKLKIYKLIPKL